MALHFFKNLLSLKPSREIPLKKKNKQKTNKKRNLPTTEIGLKKKEFKDEINFWWRNTKKKVFQSTDAADAVPLTGRYVGYTKAN